MPDTTEANRQAQILAAENALRIAEERRRNSFADPNTIDPNVAAILLAQGGQMISTAGLPNPGGIISHEPSRVPANVLAALLTQASAPTAPTGTPAAPSPAFPPIRALPPPPPVGSSGATPEMLRLQELAAQVARFTGMTPPQERNLGPVASVAAGILSAIDPEAIERLSPEIERFRRGPIEQFERERAALGQDIALQSTLGSALTEAEERRRTQRDLDSVIASHFERAQEVIDGAAAIAEEAAQSDDPVAQLAAKSIMRRVLMYRELIDNAQQAEPGALGERFVQSVEDEAQGIAEELNAYQDYLAKGQLVGMQQAGALARVQARLGQFTPSVKERYIAKLASLRNAESALAVWRKNRGVGGPLGQFNPLTVGARSDLNFHLSSLGRNFAKAEGGGGANLTELEIQIFGGAFPRMSDYTTTMESKLKNAVSYFQNSVADFEAIHPGIDQFRRGGTLVDGPASELLPGEVSVGTFDLGEGQ